MKKMRVKIDTLYLKLCVSFEFYMVIKKMISNVDLNGK